MNYKRRKAGVVARMTAAADDASLKMWTMKTKRFFSYLLMLVVCSALVFASCNSYNHTTVKKSKRGSQYHYHQRTKTKSAPMNTPYVIKNKPKTTYNLERD